MYFLDIATWQYHLAYALYLEQKENTKNVHRQYEFMNDDILNAHSYRGYCTCPCSR
uniref:Uncharacterized protein n=1 Tax=Anguilla anguilla TaxID=7936 RepID=A0A0E9S0C0_ANGAN